MNDLSLIKYTFQGVEVRTQRDGDGEPLFCLADICKVLGIQNPSDVASQLREEFTEGGRLNLDPLVTVRVETKGGTQEATFITEPQLYFVMMRSRSAFARPFRQWVVSVVLPSIRKTGAYAVPTKRENPLLSNLEAASFLYEKAGLVGNHLALALDRVAQKKTGESLLALGDVRLDTKDNEVVYTPTELGKMMVPPVSGREVNLRLIEAGLQVATGSKHGPYQPTQRGKDEGATLVDVAITGKAEPITHLKWPKSVIKLIDFEPVLDV